jgi:hydroxymethylglutaryl-CoA synthase
MSGIVAYGAYIPRLRLSRSAAVEANAWFNAGLKGMAKGERSMCNWDEDSLTMAVEAARDCLGGTVPADLNTAALASTTLPFVDRQNAGVLAAALNLDDSVITGDVSSSQRAGTSGLLSGLKAVDGTGGTSLFVAADKRRTKSGSPQEMQFGDGAAALLLGTENVIAELVGSHQLAVDFVDHYRGANEEFDYNWEERWIRDEGYFKIVPRALEGLFNEVDVTPDQIDHLVMPTVMGAVPKKIAKMAGIKGEAVRSNLHAEMGESGTAHALVMLVDLLQEAKPGETILVLGWGQGVDALVFRTTDAISQARACNGVKGSLARRREETNYNKFLAFNELVTKEHGLRGELDKQTALTSLYRNKDMLTSFLGGKCTKCGTVQYPKSNVCVNPNCREFHTQEDHPFADAKATIMNWTADNLTYSLDPPAHFGIVTFEEGGRLLADMTDVDQGTLDVGMSMRMVFRVKEYDTQRGFTKYFWKATPVTKAA